MGLIEAAACAPWPACGIQKTASDGAPGVLAEQATPPVAPHHRPGRPVRRARLPAGPRMALHERLDFTFREALAGAIGQQDSLQARAWHVVAVVTPLVHCGDTQTGFPMWAPFCYQLQYSMRVPDTDWQSRHQ
jgi:hypothetical protein